MNKNELFIEASAHKKLPEASRRVVAGIKVTESREPRCITLEGEPSAELCAVLTCALRDFLPKNGRILLAGLGNPEIACDSFGSAFVRELAPRKTADFELFTLETNIFVRTGIDSARLVRAAARELAADFVLAADALSCADPERIGRIIQLSEQEISPGSGAGESREALSARFLQTRFAWLGVPSLTPFSAVPNDFDNDENFFITAFDVAAVMKSWALCAAQSLENALCREKTS